MAWFSPFKSSSAVCARSAAAQANEMVIDGHRLNIKRHPRRVRLALRVKAQQVEVLAPPQVSLSVLEQFVRRHQAWWLKALAQSPTRVEAPTLAFENGQTWPFLDQQLRLDFRLGTAMSQQQGSNLVCWLRQVDCPRQRQHAVMQWYRQQAADYLAERTQHYGEKIGLFPEQIQIKSYTARWGSCSSRGHIQFNWKLMLCPTWVVDYVVAHELCHLKHMNHSRAFWLAVQQLYPNTPQAKAWLKQQGHAIIHSVPK